MKTISLLTFLLCFLEITKTQGISIVEGECGETPEEIEKTLTRLELLHASFNLSELQKILCDEEVPNAYCLMMNVAPYIENEHMSNHEFVSDFLSKKKECPPKKKECLPKETRGST